MGGCKTVAYQVTLHAQILGQGHAAGTAHRPQCIDGTDSPATFGAHPNAAGGRRDGYWRAPWPSQ